jgi:hypothetical protein
MEQTECPLTVAEFDAELLPPAKRQRPQKKIVSIFSTKHYLRLHATVTCKF